MSLNGKVDIIIDAIKNLVEYYTLFSTMLDAKKKTDLKVFEKMEEFFGSLKESMLKIDLSQQYSISHESISNMIFSLEMNLKEKLAPLLKLVHLMPTDALFVKQVM